ncbi:glycosyl transferase [Clostridium tertium]|uniref:Uncharacterized protein n=1 Tax=Clostridium tertium TaxID=1559 RepID=A0A6N2ZMC1_9CLOT
MKGEIIKASKYVLSHKAYILLTGYVKTKKIPNLKEPTTFYDKMQYLKINKTFKEYKCYVDKYLVRDFIEREIGEEYLVPLIGKYYSWDEVDFDILPEKFVLKANHSCGQNIICKDKSSIDKKKIKRKIKSWLHEDFYYRFREIQYKNIKPIILCEKYLEDKSGNLMDYKFICSKGEAKYIQVDVDRYCGHKQKYYDTKWNELDWSYGFSKCTDIIEKPSKLDEMLEITMKLSKRFDFVRVDLYFVDDRIYFGELSFTPSAGLLIFKPKEVNQIIGDYIEID